MRSIHPTRKATTIRRTLHAPLALLLALVAAPAAEASLTVNRMITVPAAGSGPANCQALRAALAAIDDADSDKPYLVRLEPGVYECGGEGVSKGSYIDLEGSGREVTRIVFDGGGFSTGLLVGAPGEVRHLTIRAINSAGPAGTVCALHTAGPHFDREPRVSHVDIEVSGGTFNCGLFQNSGISTILTDVRIDITENADGADNYGVAGLTAAGRLDGVRIRIDGSGGNPDIGIGVTDAGPDTAGEIRSWEIRNSRIEVVGHQEAYGLKMDGAVAALLIEGSWIKAGWGADVNRAAQLSTGATIRRSTLIGEGDGGPGIALYNEGASGDSHDVTVDASELLGSHNTLRNDADFDTRVAGSFVAGGPVDAALGTLTCAGVWDEGFAFSASSCP